MDATKGKVTIPAGGRPASKVFAELAAVLALHLTELWPNVDAKQPIRWTVGKDKGGQVMLDCSVMLKDGTTETTNIGPFPSTEIAVLWMTTFSQTCPLIKSDVVAAADPKTIN